jgi:Uma2 family endonuclease
MTIQTEVLTVMRPAEGVKGPPQGQWTYADYTALPEDGNRYEIIKGVLYMAPSPNFGHQRSSVGFSFYLRLHVKNTGLGEIIVAPFDVELTPGGAVVQPDVMVILKDHLDRITNQKVEGAPDLVVEIASPATAGYDRREKQDAYAAAGVPEYWIADPASRTVELLVLAENNTYRSLGVFKGEIALPSTIIPDLPVKVEQFFE